jgi:hypothetical protein
MCDCRRGFGLYIRFIDHLHTRLGITSNYSATANIRNSQIITAPAKRFPACCVFMSRSLGRPDCLQDSSSARTTQKHHVSNSTSIVVRRFVALRTCLPSRCLEMSLVYSSISRSSHSNGSPPYSIVISLLLCSLFLFHTGLIAQLTNLTNLMKWSFTFFCPL